MNILTAAVLALMLAASAATAQTGPFQPNPGPTTSPGAGSTGASMPTGTAEPTPAQCARAYDGSAGWTREQFVAACAKIHGTGK